MADFVKKARAHLDYCISDLCDLYGEGADSLQKAHAEASLSEAIDQLLEVNRERAVLPTIVCLCGSTRFYEAFQQANYDETMAGRIVLSVGFYPHSKAASGHGEGVGHDSAEKIALDELHKRKIDLADEILVLNVGGYIGSSTRGEIEYAEQRGRPVRYLEPV